MNAKKLLQIELQRLGAGVSMTTINNYFSGRRNAGYTIAKALSRILGGGVEVWQDSEKVGERRRNLKVWAKANGCEVYTKRGRPQ